MLRLAGWSLCCGWLMLGGCQRQQESRILARVGDATLTLESARAVLDTTSTAYDIQLRDYVTSWVDAELLAQEAKRQGLDDTPEIQTELDQVRRTLARESLLHKQIYSDSTRMTDETLRDYFQHHAGEFFVSEDMVRLNVASFAERNRASQFAARVSRDSSWTDALNAVQADSVAASALVARSDGQVYTQRSIFPPELWKVSTTLGTNDVSFPVKTSEGYCVVQLLARAQKGQPADFDLVRDEVFRRVLIEERRSAYEKLLGTLRKRYHVQVLINQNGSDSVKQPNHE